ncbi:hypothetical protein U1Q18_004817, partial [Sarracenia purpurea var. burkii]
VLGCDAGALGYWGGLVRGVLVLLCSVLLSPHNLWCWFSLPMLLLSLIAAAIWLLSVVHGFAQHGVGFCCYGLPDGDVWSLSCAM